MELGELGVTPAKQTQFGTRGIKDVRQLLEYMPRKYKDYSKITGILPPEQMSCVVLYLESIKSYTGRMNKQDTVIANCIEVNTGIQVKVFWFAPKGSSLKWRAAMLSKIEGKSIYAVGHMEQDGNVGYKMVCPEVFEPDIDKSMRLYPVYKTIKGMSTKYFMDKMELALLSADAYFETIPDDIVKRENLTPINKAYQYIHSPTSYDEIKVGEGRITFNDLLYFALHNEWNKREISAGSSFNIKTLALKNAIQASLPFQLTEDQEQALDEMIENGVNGKRINALVQGDVGCGKTIVAQLLCAAFVGSGYQAAILAPTQVLAKQHYTDTVKLFEPLGIKVAFLSGEKMKKAERNAVLESISSGDAKIIVGTHAVFSKDVNYKKLALTIVDEEHRFGVAQRAALTEKAAEGVHSITMSATPIPRSLAMVLYGDTIQIHTIQTMPNGRLPVITGKSVSRERTYRFLLSQIRRGRQAYVVCPLIEESEKLEGVKSVNEISEEYKAALEPCGIVIETLTGRNTKEETEEVIERFKNGEINILIATTIIEVGINVPNATAMVITNAERFGLSQLHQLRGRVGRGNYQSYCVLESENINETGEARLNTFCGTANGFEIAQADLRLRGAGDFLGTKQSGENKYIMLMLAYPDIYNKAKEIAKELLDRGAACCELATKVAKERNNNE